MRVLDQRGDLSEIPLPTGRAAFMERLNAVLGARADAAAAAAAEGAAEDAARALTAVEQLRDDLVVAHGATLRRVFVRDGDEVVLVVLALPPERIAFTRRGHELQGQVRKTTSWWQYSRHGVRGHVDAQIRGRRSGTNRGVHVPHFLDGRGHVRSIARRGGVAASAGRRFMCPHILLRAIASACTAPEPPNASVDDLR